MAKGDDIKPLVLFEFFGWICFLCGEKVDKRLRFPNWRAATIDHVVPLSKGGTHTWGNVVPAHAKCNWDKGDGVDIPPP